MNAGVYQCVNGTFAATGNGGTWGTIGGTLANQTDIWNALQAKQPLMTLGTTGQYLRGDGSLGTLAAGTNVTLTQSGNTLTVAATGSGGTWGTIGGTLANQTDLWNALQAKQPLMTVGTAGQYVRGDGSLGTLAAGTNVTLTQSGNTLTVAATGSGGTWGTIGGTLANQTDLWNALQAKQPLMTLGTTGQYLRGDGSLGTLAAGANVTLTQSGNTLTVAATGGSGGGLALSGTPATNDLLSYNGSAAADSGVSVSGGVVTAAGFQSTGTGGTQITISEGNAPATPSTNQRVLWADSAQHWLRTTDYNGVNWMLMRSTALGGSGNGVKWSADGSLGDLGYAPPSVANANTWTAKQTFVPGAAGAGMNVGSMAGNPNAPTNGDVWYNSTSNALNAQINGSTVSLGAGGGGSGANANAYYVVSQTANAPANALNLGALPSGLLKASVTGNVAAVSTVSTARAFGYSFNGNGSALSAGATGYLTVPFACTISAWNMSVDQGTAAVDIWKAPTGSSIPNSGNSITASATPAISTGTSIHSTMLTGWTTAVAANDIVAINLEAAANATFVNLTVQCDQ